MSAVLVIWLQILVGLVASAASSGVIFAISCAVYDAWAKRYRDRSRGW